MQPRHYRQPSITSYLNRKAAKKSNNSVLKYGNNNRNKKKCKILPFSLYASPSPSVSLSQSSTQTNAIVNNKKDHYKPELSPSPTEMMSNLELEKNKKNVVQFQYNSNNIQRTLSQPTMKRRAKKRKLSIHSDDDNLYSNQRRKKPKLTSTTPTTSNNNNYLKKVTLSDGSVCFTMTCTSKQEEPINHPSLSSTSSSPSSLSSCSLSTSSSMSSSSSLSSPSSLYQPPTKKRKQNPCTLPSTSTSTYTQLHDSKNDDNNSTKKKISKKPKLIYSNTMPSFSSADKIQKTVENNKKNVIKKEKKRRRHSSSSSDWTARDNLFCALVKQESIEEKLFPSSNIPEVNLKEIFNGQQYIRVHKKVRAINDRRETKIFK